LNVDNDGIFILAPASMNAHLHPVEE